MVGGDLIVAVIGRFCYKDITCCVYVDKAKSSAD